MRPNVRGPRWSRPRTSPRARRGAANTNPHHRRPSAAKVDLLVHRLTDARGRRVMFVSHCLLNQNVRYLGGATTPGAIGTILDRCRDEGLGICQIPCPEQRAWGGVLKHHMLRLYGVGPLHPAARRALTVIATGYTRLRYRRLARRVARDISDYQRNGFEVVEVLGVGASPSCGVFTTLPLGPSLAAIAACDPATLSPDEFNERVIQDGVTLGRGLFIDELARQCRRRRLHVTISEHDLRAELDAARCDRAKAASC